MKRLIKFTTGTLILLLSVFAACTTQKQTARRSGTECLPMQFSDDEIQGDSYTLDTLRITDNCLNVTVSYDGGCGTASAQLFYGNRILQSYPPQTVLQLRFKDDDPCRSVTSKTFSFDLKPFEKQAAAGGILLKIKGSSQSVLFKIPDGDKSH